MEAADAERTAESVVQEPSEVAGSVNLLGSARSLAPVALLKVPTKAVERTAESVVQPMAPSSVVLEPSEVAGSIDGIELSCWRPCRLRPLSGLQSPSWSQWS